MQMPGLIQAAPTTAQFGGSPATPAVKKAGGQGMDFMSVLRLLLTGGGFNAANTETGKILANSRTSQFNQFLSATVNDASIQKNTGMDITAPEAALLELLAILPDGLLQNGDFSVRLQEVGLQNPFPDSKEGIPEFNSWLDADNPNDGTVLWNYRPQESITAKTADIHDFSALTGRLILNQEQIQQLSQFLSRDDLQQALNQWQQNMLVAENPDIADNIANGIIQSLQVLNQGGIQQTPEQLQQNMPPAEKPASAGNIANGTIQSLLQVLNQDGIQQTPEQLRQNMPPAEKPSSAGNTANGTIQSLPQVLNQDGIQQTPEQLRQNMPPAEKPSSAVNDMAPTAEQLSVSPRDMMKNQVEKTPHSVLQTQPVSGKAETGSGINVDYAEPRPLAQDVVLVAASTGATAGQDNATGPSNVKAAFEMPNNTLRADQTQIAANVVDSTATVAKSMGGEAPPTVRSNEQPLLFTQLAEAIRGQIARDGHGRTHVRLQLQPESLGEVVIKLVYKDGNVSTHFHAATESVRQAIESSLGQLREALTIHNLNLQQTTVTAGEDQGRWAQEPNREHRFDSPYRQSGDGSGEKEETASEPLTEQPKTANRYSVNHFV